MRFILYIMRRSQFKFEPIQSLIHPHY